MRQARGTIAGLEQHRLAARLAVRIAFDQLARFLERPGLGGLRGFAQRWMKMQVGHGAPIAARRPNGKKGGIPRDFMIRSAVVSRDAVRLEEHTSELQSLMRISYAVFCLKNTNIVNVEPHITSPN